MADCVFLFESQIDLIPSAKFPPINVTDWFFVRCATGRNRPRYTNIYRVCMCKWETRLVTVGFARCGTARDWSQATFLSWPQLPAGQCLLRPVKGRDVNQSSSLHWPHIKLPRGLSRGWDDPSAIFRLKSRAPEPTPINKRPIHSELISYEYAEYNLFISWLWHLRRTIRPYFPLSEYHRARMW